MLSYFLYLIQFRILYPKMRSTHNNYGIQDDPHRHALQPIFQMILDGKLNIDITWCQEWHNTSTVACFILGTKQVLVHGQVYPT